MSYRKIIPGSKPLVKNDLVFDTKPTRGSANPVTSECVAVIKDELDEMKMEFVCVKSTDEYGNIYFDKTYNDAFGIASFKFTAESAIRCAVDVVFVEAEGLPLPHVPTINVTLDVKSGTNEVRIPFSSRFPVGTEVKNYEFNRITLSSINVSPAPNWTFTESQVMMLARRV